MEKIRLRMARSAGGSADWDGETLVTTAPTFTLTNGWWEAIIPGGFGAVPAGLFGKSPAGDCYVLHAAMYATEPLTTSDVLRVRTPAPVNTRDAFVPALGNNVATLVRADDILTFRIATTDALAVLELMLEPLAQVNEFGPILLDYVRERSRSVGPLGITEQQISANTVLNTWRGTLRVTSTAAAAIILTLPPADEMTLNDLLIVSRNGAGAITITPAGTDTLNRAAATDVITINNTSRWLRGAGTDWAVG